MAADKDLDFKVKDDSPEGLPAYRNEVQDPEMDGLTLYEKKALLVNRELDSHGMGKYQWVISLSIQTFLKFAVILDLEIYSKVFYLQYISGPVHLPQRGLLTSDLIVVHLLLMRLRLPHRLALCTSIRSCRACDTARIRLRR